MSGIELFVYYRVRLDRVAQAHEAVRAMQAGLCSRHPALHVRLLRRPEVEAGCETWMETYAGDGEGLSPAVCRDIDEQAGALAPLIDGVRHTEAFVPIPLHAA